MVPAGLPTRAIPTPRVGIQGRPRWPVDSALRGRLAPGLFLVGVLALLGCSRGEVGTDGADAAAASETRGSAARRESAAVKNKGGQQEKSPESTAPGVDTAEVVAGPDDLMSLDPRQDGWITEHFNTLAAAQLGQVAKLLADPSSLHHGQLAPLLTDGFACARLRPGNAETAVVDGALQVERMEAWGESHVHRGPEGLQEALRDVLGSLVECRDVHTKFKIVRVRRQKDAVQTVQLVEISGATPSGVTEQHATWEIHWQWDGGDAAPRLQTITATGFEQTTFRSAGKTLFSDCTRAVFGEEPAILEDQLLVGIDNWVRRIEAHYNVNQFGHNGLAVGDANGDGLDDVYICQAGGLPNRLLLAREDGAVVDASASAGVDYLDNTRAALFLDLDNDRDQDLALTLPQAVLLLRNDGRGKFTPVVRVPGVEDAFSLAAADYDHDSDLDIYACVYYSPNDQTAELPIPTPLYDARNGGRNVLIQNAGNWNFRDATVESGLDADNMRFSFAAVWEDYDNDGDQDLFVANDYGPNNLYRNDEGRFSDVTKTVGMDDGAFGMSAAAADYNRDGWIDFYKANMFSSAGNRVTFQEQFMPQASDAHKHRFRHMARGNTLFENRAGQFRDASVQAGVTMGRWSWGSLFADFNNDGWEDLLVTNGFITGTQLDDL